MATNRDRRRLTANSTRHLHELPEQALQRVVEGAHFEQTDRGVAGQARQRRRQLAGLAGLHDEAAASGVERHAGDRLEPDERGRQAAPVVGAHEHVPRAVVHRVADGVMTAGGGEAAVDQHDHPLG